MPWVLLAIPIVGNPSTFYDEPKICPPCKNMKFEDVWGTVEVIRRWVL